jgi:hypothetical protein
VYGSGVSSALAAKAASSTIPLVFLSQDDPVKMSDGSLDSQVGARICNGLGIMRACFETQKLEQLEARMEKIIEHVPYTRISTDEAEVYVPSEANGYDHAVATRMISTDETERHPN